MGQWRDPRKTSRRGAPAVAQRIRLYSRLLASRGGHLPSGFPPRILSCMYRNAEMLGLRALHSIPLLYVVMFLTGWRLIVDLVHQSWYYPQMMHESGNLSIWYLILTLSITPALAIINHFKRGIALGRWLLRRRKHFGIASFIYAAAHTLHYIRYINDFTLIWLEALDLEYLVGWLGLILFLVLAVTSNKASVRWLGRRWKPLHRSIYLATALTWLHWYLFEFFTEEVFFWGAFLLLARVLQRGLRWLTQALRPRGGPVGQT